MSGTGSGRPWRRVSAGTRERSTISRPGASAEYPPVAGSSTGSGGVKPAQRTGSCPRCPRPPGRAASGWGGGRAAGGRGARRRGAPGRRSARRPRPVSVSGRCPRRGRGPSRTTSREPGRPRGCPRTATDRSPYWPWARSFPKGRQKKSPRRTRISGGASAGRDSFHQGAVKNGSTVRPPAAKRAVRWPASSVTATRTVVHLQHAAGLAVDGLDLSSSDCLLRSIARNPAAAARACGAGRCTSVSRAARWLARGRAPRGPSATARRPRRRAGGSCRNPRRRT